MIDPDTFRSVLGRFASGVTVITVATPAGDYGMTVTAFCSLSLDPPLVLACIDHAAKMHAVLPTVSHFAANVLESGQEPLARRFADPEADRFDGVGVRRTASGAPLIDNVLASLDCRIVNSFPGGDHTIFVGAVEAAELGKGEPLLYFRGGYTQLGT